MAVFKPVWRDGNQTLATIREGDSVSVQLEVDEILVGRSVVGQFSLEVGPVAGRVTRMTLDGADYDFHLVGTQIQFSTIPYRGGEIKLYALPVARYAIESGSLPVGLTLNPANGQITGTVRGPLGSSQVFSFTVRAEMAGGTASRRFSFITPQTFIPRWTTPAGQLGAVSEGSFVSLQLSADEVMTTTVLASQFVLVVGPAANRTQKVLINDMEVAFEIIGETIRFPTASARSTIQVVASPDLTHTLINGALPPGLILTGDVGRIEGTVGNITTGETVEYEFTLRISNGSQSRDRTFIITANGLVQEAAISEETLPSPARDPQRDVIFYPLGTVRRGSTFVFRFDITDPDAMHPRIIVRRATGLPDNGTDFAGLPAGLSVNGYQIQGTITPTVAAGRYWFEVSLTSTTARYLCAITVAPGISTTTSSVPKIEWITPSGSIGTLREGEASHFKIAAKRSGTAPLTYLIVAGAMPPGLTVDTASGEVLGKVSYIEQSATYRFTLRATTDNTFVDREFSIDAISVFTSNSIHVVSLRPYARDAELMLRPYARLLSASSLFRPEDTNFGLKRSASIYVIGGLNPMGDIEEAMAGDGTLSINGRPDYHGPTDLILGEHRVAKAYDDTGNLLYEVLYRILYDPQARAGGFLYDHSEPVEEKIVYPHQANTFVYPNSLRNMRSDLVRDVGFATVDPLKERMMGPTGSEAMPLWMRCRQNPAVPASRLGFTPALVIAHLMPGAGQTVLDLIAASKSYDIITDGKLIRLDKIEISGGAPGSSTVFDIGTRFDFQTSFDGNDEQGSVIRV